MISFLIGGLALYFAFIICTSVFIMIIENWRALLPVFFWPSIGLAALIIKILR